MARAEEEPDMPTLHYPSTTFPGRPELGLDLPEGWAAAPSAVQVPGVALAAVKEGDPETFRPTLVVSLAEVAPGHTPMTDLDALAADAQERTEGVVGEPFLRTVSGISFFGRDLSHVDDIAGTLLARTLFGFVKRESDGALVRITVVGTIGTVDHTAEFAALTDLIGALRVTPAAGTTPMLDATGDQG